MWYNNNNIHIVYMYVYTPHTPPITSHSSQHLTLLPSPHTPPNTSHSYHHLTLLPTPHTPPNTSHSSHHLTLLPSPHTPPTYRCMQTMVISLLHILRRFGVDFKLIVSAILAPSVKLSWRRSWSVSCTPFRT